MRKDEFPIIEEYCKEKIVKELKELKTEMENYCDYHAIYDWGLIDLIDERISELKGENK